MCNLSENLVAEALERGIEKGIEQGIEKGIAQGAQKERRNALARMLQIGLAKEQILLCGYTEDEFVEAEAALCR